MIKWWSTKIEARSPVTGEMATFDGPSVPGRTAFEAQMYCEKNELGYCKVVRLNSHVDIYSKGNPVTAFWKRDIEFDKISKN